MKQILDLKYAEVNGRTLALDILQPKVIGNVNFPVVLWLHGGGWQAGNKRNAIKNGSLEFLVNEGYVVASVEYRLSSEAVFPAQLHDVKSAIQWIRINAETFQIDPTRITVAGFSAGAHLAALAATTGNIPELETPSVTAGCSSMVQAAIAISAPTDFARNPAVKDTSLNAAILEGDISGEEKLLGGPVEGNLELAQMANPGAFVCAETPPILIIHGTDDEVVPVSQADYLYERLSNENTEVTYVRILKGNHGCWHCDYPYPNKPIPQEIEQWILDFLENHILNKSSKKIKGHHSIPAPIPLSEKEKKT